MASTEVATAQSPSLLATMAARFGVESGKMLATLKATAFKGEVSNEQMMALLIVANEYGLNPWTKEIYAFPDKNNGIVPVLGVDGWARLMNSNPAFDGLEFEEGGDGNGYWVEAIIYRKDRAHPTKIKEYLSECKRNTGPWGSHPRRMLRHKALIQCARVAFSYGGVYDEDEAQQILERDVTPDPLPVTKGATAKLRQVATIEQMKGGEDANATNGTIGPVDDSGAPEHGAGTVDRDPRQPGPERDNGGAGDAPASEGGKEGTSPAPVNVAGAPPPTPSATVIRNLRAAKTIEALDDIASLVDGRQYTAIETVQINKAYRDKKEVLEAGGGGKSRPGME